MRRWVALIIILAASKGSAAPPEVKIDPLNYTPPRAERVVLSNGVIVYIQEDHELPLVELTLLLRNSPSLEPSPDVFAVMGDAWRTGGTTTISPSDFDAALENTATSVSVSVGPESASLSLSALTKNTGSGLALFFGLLFHPDFQSAPLSLVKDQKLEDIRRQNESIAEIGRRAFRDAVYGSSHVYAQNPKTKTVKAVTRALLFKAHSNIVDPQGAVLSVSGDFSNEDMIKKLELFVKDWKPRRTKQPTYDFSIKAPPAGSVFFVEKDFTQSRIILGRTGPARHNPDEYALKMADSILGAGGPSRLFSEIRSRQGLAYVVGSVYYEREGPGVIAVVCQTMAPATLKATEAILSELDKFASAPPKPEELDIAKESTINSYVFGFVTPGDIVNAWASNEFYGYSEAYLVNYTKQIGRVTPADIFQVAKKYYRRDDMKIVIVGDRKKIGMPLDSLGPVVTVPLDRLD